MLSLAVDLDFFHRGYLDNRPRFKTKQYFQKENDKGVIVS
jgi:hypothetical protein